MNTAAPTHDLFRNPSDNSGKPHSFNALPRGRLRIRPTRYGFIFLAMLGALLLGSVNHNNNLGYLLTFLLGGMAFSSLFHTRRNMNSLILTPPRCRPVFAGQIARFAFTILGSPGASPILSFRFSEGEAIPLTLPPGGKTTVEVPVSAVKRGLLRPSSLLMSTSYPLGLFQASRSIPVHATCLVYPKPAPGPLLSVPGPDDHESEGDSGGSGVEDFAGLDAYQPGDPLQHISWKSYSRGQGLYSKKFEGLRGKSVYFDPDALTGLDIETKLARVCFMILKAEAMRTPYGLKLGGRVRKPSLGEKHKRQCLSELALAGRRRSDAS